MSQAAKFPSWPSVIASLCENTGEVSTSTVQSGLEKRDSALNVPHFYFMFESTIVKSVCFFLM